MSYSGTRRSHDSLKLKESYDLLRLEEVMVRWQVGIIMNHQYILILVT